MSELFPSEIFDLSAEIRETAALFPDRVAVIEPHEGARRGEWNLTKYTYAQLSRDADTIAAALHAKGFKAGMRTVFMAPPSYEAAAVGIALSQVGVTFLWIDPSVGYRNVAERLSRVKPEAFVGIPISLAGKLIFGWGRRFGMKNIVLQGSFPGAMSFKSLVNFKGSRQTPPDVKPSDPSNVLYTTGSTGPAKPALYTHSQFSNVYRTATYSWRFHEYEDDIPVDMAAFAAFLFIGLLGRGTMVVPPYNFVKTTPATTPAREVCDVIEAANVHSLFASPAFLERIAAHATDNPQQLRSLRRVIGGGAPMFAPLIRALKAVIPEDAEVWSNYGATEALPSTEMGCKETLEETAALTDEGAGICVGRPFPNNEVRVVGPIDQSSTQLSDYEVQETGAIGELIVRGPNISTEYFWDPASTAKNKLYGADGTIWHRLGDVGHLDEKGRVWVAGRVSQCVRVGEDLLLPIAIEAIFDKHPAVRRSGLGVRTTGGTDQAVVAIELKSALPSAEQQALLQDFNASLKTDERLRAVSEVIILAALPVDPRHNAKIERGKLSLMINKAS